MANHTPETGNPLADNLVRIHKMITRSLKVSVSKCDEYIRNKGIPPSEEKGFLLYMSTMIRVMHAHHMGEDDVVFPYFKDRIEAPFSRLKDEHLNMSGMLDNLEKGIARVTLSDIGKIRNLLADIQRLWEPHIRSEEINFSAETLKNIDAKEQLELMDRVGRHSQKASGPGPTTIPFVLYNLEKDDREKFLREFPWILKKVLVPIIWRRQWRSMDPFLLN